MQDLGGFAFELDLAVLKQHCAISILLNRWQIMAGHDDRHAFIPQLSDVFEALALKFSIADGEAYTVPATIEDPAVLDESRDALRGIGYAGAARSSEEA